MSLKEMVNELSNDVKLHVRDNLGLLGLVSFAGIDGGLLLAANYEINKGNKIASALCFGGACISMFSKIGYYYLKCNKSKNEDGVVERLSD